MDKKILLEINRFREIMGQNLLLESAPPFNLLQQILTMFGKSADTTLSNLLKKGGTIDPLAPIVKTQIDNVAKKFGISYDNLVKKIQLDDFDNSPEIFDSLVASLMKSDKYFYDTLFRIYVENSRPLKQIEDLTEFFKQKLYKKIEETGYGADAEEVGNLQKQLFKTVDENPTLGEEVKTIMKEKIARELSEFPISPKKVNPNFVPQPDPSWTSNFKLKSDSDKMSDWQTLGRPYNEITYKNLGPFKDQIFDPQRIKWIDFGELQSVEKGELIVRKVARLVIDDKVPFLMYTSSGKSTPGLKKEGQWTIFSGWVLDKDGEIGWWIKGTKEQILWTQGDSEFFTGLANYLKNNNIDGLKKY